MKFNGKTVLVTGSSRGIGLAIARCFSLAGATVVLNCAKSAGELDYAKKSIQAEGGTVYALMGDVSDYETCRNLITDAAAYTGSIDILVNNAGIDHIGLFTDMTASQWDTVIRNNLYSVLNCTHLVLPGMVAKKDGCIINISSIWGEKGASCEAVYSASKGAVNAFTKAIARETGPSCVRVNAISCGVIDTRMNQWLSKEEENTLVQEIPLMRFGNPQAVGELCLYLAGADYITGQIIRCDGGMI